MSADTSGYIKGCCSPPSEVDARNKQERATPSHRDQTQTLPLPTDTYAKKNNKTKNPDLEGTPLCLSKQK